MNAPVGVGVGAAVGNVDPTGAKLAGTGLKAVSGVAIAGAGSEDEGTGAQAVCSGVVCAGPGVGGTGAKSPCTGVNAPASVDATGGNVDPTGVKPATGLKAVSGADTVGFRSEDEGIGAQAACVGADAAGDAVGTFVPHPPQKTAVSFNAEPQLPQNLAIVFSFTVVLSLSFICWQTSCPFTHASTLHAGCAHVLRECRSFLWGATHQIHSWIDDPRQCDTASPALA